MRCSRIDSQIQRRRHGKFEANAATLYESLQRLLAYPEDVLVLPAHDPSSPDPPETATLGEVTAKNEDIQRSREETLASDISDH